MVYIVQSGVKEGKRRYSMKTKKNEKQSEASLWNVRSGMGCFFSQTDFLFSALLGSILLLAKVFRMVFKEFLPVVASWILLCQRMTLLNSSTSVLPYLVTQVEGVIFFLCLGQLHYFIRATHIAFGTHFAKLIMFYFISGRNTQKVFFF